jgi:membrane-bound ClpP family serine protease
MLAVYSADAFPISRLVRFAGIGAAVAAVYLAPVYPIRFAGLLCLFAAAVLFVIDFWSKLDYVAGVVAVIAVPIGFMLFYSGPRRIDNLLAVSLGFIFSSASAGYCWKAKRARLNKIADL